MIRPQGSNVSNHAPDNRGQRRDKKFSVGDLLVYSETDLWIIGSAIVGVIFWAFGIGALAHAVPCLKAGASMQRCCRLTAEDAAELSSECARAMSHELKLGIFGMISL